MEAIQSALRTTLESVMINARLADAVDVLLLAALLYLIFSWLRDRVSRVVGFGITTVAVLYGLAHVLDLYLVSRVFQVGLTAIAVALVIVFQDDIRRFFERLRTFSLREARGGGGRADWSGLVEAVDELATRRIGALIVLPGREAVDVHLHGGVEANAELSPSLLLSIFHPKTDGHDGAVIVEESRISRFGVHLPLSTNRERLREAGSGTRHAAALGLAERCDALVVVVSEERGTITLAREGRLESVADAEALRAAIAEFELRGGARAGGERRRRWWRKNLGLKFASVVLASLLWGIFAFRVESVQRTYEVPVEYRGLAGDWYIPEPKPITARVELAGSERAFDEVDPAELRVAVDRDEIDQGPAEIDLTEEHINAPEGISVTAFEPGSLRLEAHRLVDKEVDIEAQFEGEMPEGYAIDRVKVEPGRLSVRVPSHLEDYLGEVTTEPIAVDQLRQSKRFETGIVLPDHVRAGDEEPSEVEVNVEVSREVIAPQSTPVPGDEES
ncbi:MAG: diadenylate cyclase [Persicimonas sp.]